jgi:uncharacterized protein YigE (DUF2233 family)
MRTRHATAPRGRTTGLARAALGLALVFAACAAPPPGPPPAVAAAPADGVEVRTATFRGASYTVVRVDLRRAEVRTLWKDAGGAPYATLERAARDGGAPVAVMNGGIYTTTGEPEGLYVEGGRTLVPLNLGDGEGNFYLKPNGVFYVAADGAGVVEAPEFPAVAARTTVRGAAQSGPLLARGGRLHPAFSPDSDSRHVRNGVGVVSPAEVVFAVSETPVTLHDLASLFVEALGCRDALYLDGCVSQLMVPGLGLSAPAVRPCPKELAGLLAVFARRDGGA